MNRLFYNDSNFNYFNFFLLGIQRIYGVKPTKLSPGKEKWERFLLSLTISIDVVFYSGTHI